MLKLFSNSFSIFIVVILLAVICAILFYYTYSEIERSAKDVALGEIQNVSMTQTHDSGKIIENALMDIVTNLKTIANSPTLQQYKDINDMLLLMNAGQSSTQQITDYYRIIDKNGKIIAASNLLDNHQQYNKSNDQNFSNRSHFIIPKEINKVYISNLINSINKIPRFSISMPILINEVYKNEVINRTFSSDTTNNEYIPINNTLDKTIFNGIIEASIKINKLDNLLELSILSSEQNEITLLDREGTIMFTANKDLLGGNFFSDKVQSLMFNSLPLKELENINKLVNDALNGKSGIYNLNTTSQTSTFSSRPISLEGDQFMTLLINKPYNLDTEVIYFLNLQRNFSTIAILIIVFVSSILGYFLFTWNKRLQTKVNNQTIKLNQNIKQLRKTNEQLHQNDKMQKEFINITAHELRTPIQSIMGYTEMMKSFPEKTANYVQPIERNAQRLYKLIQDILDITKIESRNFVLKKTQFDLQEKINTVINDLTTAKKLDGINQNVKFIFHPNESFKVFADKERIYQVISNLIRNAAKFTHGDQAKIEIILEKVKKEKKEEDEWISVQIRDNGTGIDQEILPRLFSKFTTTSEFGGTGLGLYISKKIIEAHGGTIRGYNNNLNGEKKGATFEFILPLYKTK
ncbi:MAG TPA: sensor histidine kinase [Nitrososphaeraceae archaeon]|nr:sensor histidine kinase [Nitrososphaeraceae archaeon]